MDTKKPSLQWRKAELIDRIERSRYELADHLDSTARSLNVVSAVRHSFRQDTWKWLGGAVALGLVLTRPRRNAPKTVVQKAPAAGLLGFASQTALGLVQPYLMILLQRTVERLVELYKARAEAGPAGGPVVLHPAWRESSAGY